jgi:apolipoprotein D and lipocalin family protein
MKLKKWLMPSLLISGIGTLLFINACSGVKVPTGVSVVKPFDVEKYTGTWYEIARFDFTHEKNMSNVTATYTLQDNGTVGVLNKGFDEIKQKWKEAKGKAKFVGDRNEGALKVSFFGPFYAGYNVVMMEPDYENVLIFGEDRDYIWILSRNKTISSDVKQKFLDRANAAGYDVSRLVWTKQD